MRRLGITISVLFVLVPAALAAADAPARYQATPARELHPGVDFFTMGRQDAQDLAYVARLAPGARVAMRTVLSNNEVAHDSSPLELPSSMCARVRCIVGINADFHDDSHEAVGGVVAGGRMLRSPSPGHEQLSITRNGSLVAGKMPWSASLGTSKGAMLDIDEINVSAGPDRVVLYTPAWGDRTRTANAVELVLQAHGPVGVLGQTITVQLSSLGGPGSAIPADGAVLSGSGTAATRLRNLWDKVRADKGVLRVDSPVDALESVGGNPVLLRQGKPAFPPSNDGFTTWRNPRTLVGWNGTGTIFLVAVDGRRDDAMGMTMAEAADFLLKLGATDGINLDGGGGTTFVVDGSVMNRPSDGSSPTESLERAAVNSLVVVPVAGSADPRTPGSPAAPGTPGQPRPAPGSPLYPGSPALPGTEEAPTGFGEFTDWTEAMDTTYSDPGAVLGGPVTPGTPADGPSTGGRRAAASGTDKPEPGGDGHGRPGRGGGGEQAALAMAERAAGPGKGGQVNPMVFGAGAAVVLLSAVTAPLGILTYRRRRRRLRRSWLTG